MPELPEAETVRRVLEATIRGRTIARVWLSGLPLREPIAKTVPEHLARRRHRQYLRQRDLASGEN